MYFILGMLYPKKFQDEVWTMMHFIFLGYFQTIDRASFSSVAENDPVVALLRAVRVVPNLSR